MKNAHPEDDLQTAIVSYLRHALPPASILHSIPNGAQLAGNGRQRAFKMTLLKRTGLRPGASDLFVLWNGRAIYMEVKAPGTTASAVSKEQRQFGDDACAAGGFFSVVRSIHDVETFLRSLGVPLRASVMA